MNQGVCNTTRRALDATHDSHDTDVETRHSRRRSIDGDARRDTRVESET